MEWYNGANDTIWTVEISDKGTVKQIIYDQHKGARRRIYTKNPLGREILLDEKVLKDAFAVAINTCDDQQIYELSKILKGRDAKIFESIIKAKIEQCIDLLANLKRD